MRVPSGRSGGTNPGPALGVGAVVNNVQPAPKGGVKGITTNRPSVRPSSSSTPRTNKTGTSSGGPSAGNTIASAPPGTGPVGTTMPPSLASRGLAGSITQAQLRASLQPQGNYMSLSGGPSDKKRRRGSY